MKWLFALAFAAIACSSSSPAGPGVPPSFVSVTAPASVTLSADNLYHWTVQYTYADSDDQVTQLTWTLASHGSSTSVPQQAIPAAQPGSLTQGFTVDFPAASKGKSYDYAFVLVDQSGLQSAPSSGTVTFN